MDLQFVAVTKNVDPVERDTSIDRRIGLFEAGLIGGVVGGKRKQGRKVPSRGTPGCDDEIRISAVVSDFLANPLHRALHVEQMVGKRGLRAPAVIFRGPAVLSGINDVLAVS